jgi:hypothetical protein
MNLSDTVITALIAGGISLLVSLITYFTTKQQIITEREKLERQLERKFTERLYDLRLQHYVKAFQITEGLSKVAPNKEGLASGYQEIREQLKDWRAGEVAFIMSDKALKTYYELQRVLKKNPEMGDKYSEAQIQKIWRARNRFRGVLRADVGLLFKEEKDSEPIE